MGHFEVGEMGQKSAGVDNSYQYTPAELYQIIVSDPFDHTEPPRSLKLVELAEWLEAILT